MQKCKIKHPRGPHFQFQGTPRSITMGVQTKKKEENLEENIKPTIMIVHPAAEKNRRKIIIIAVKKKSDKQRNAADYVGER